MTTDQQKNLILFNKPLTPCKGKNNYLCGDLKCKTMLDLKKHSLEKAENILNREVEKHLNYYPGDKLKELDKHIEYVNGLVFITASYERENAKMYNLKYFRIVVSTDEGNKILFNSSNVIDYNDKTVFYTIDDLKKDFKNYLNYFLNKF